MIPRDLDACLARIRERDPSIHAWVKVDPQPATGEGPLSEALSEALSGVPFGAKDIIETRGLPTEYGSPVYRGRIGSEDAAIIKTLRGLGAVLVGKTHTTAFAYRDPAPTRNPHNLQHTPGGSSSGSAAAVAAGMVPLALGTQTQGSVLRPASFCGIVGFKPTYGLLSMEGILQFASSLDTLGFFTRTVAEAIEVWEALQPYVGLSPSYVGRLPPETGSPSYVGQLPPESESPSYVGRLPRRGAPSSEPRTRQNPDVVLGQNPDFDLGYPAPMPVVEPPMAAAFQDALTRLRDAGVSLRPVDLGDMLDRLNDASRVIMSYEAARFHEARYREYGDRLGVIANLIRDGLAMSTSAYDEARRYVDACGERISEVYKRTPTILVPAAAGPAPAGLSSTGDPRMNAPWTALGTPAISVPMGTHDGLPLGLQITADRGEDSLLLGVALHVGRTLSGSP